MARALIVGCGCRGRKLGAALLERGWRVRGTTRDPKQAAGIEAVRIEPAIADPDRVGSILELISDVTLIYWLLGSARGQPYAVAQLHGPRLERILEDIVDTPVRGFVYEAAGTVPAESLQTGAGIARAASTRWRIPVAIAEATPDELPAWRARMLGYATELTEVA
jgi:nucleoside-diphosphate-sugar epimerase